MKITATKCSECKGTGSSEPECRTCKGERWITAKRAYRHGWRKADLIEMSMDGWCECPECYDDARTCMFCNGNGNGDPFIDNQQQMRVLVCALNGTIPLVFRTEVRGDFIQDGDMFLLSRQATRQCRDDGFIYWFSSPFGDQISLSDKGKLEAKKAWSEYRELCRRWIAAERVRREQRQNVISSHHHEVAE